MFKINYNQIVNMEYKVIFEYFDKPLSFISEVENRNYFFHFLDDSIYFIAELHKQDINYLNDVKDVFSFINHLLDNEDLFILEINDSSVEYHYINDYQISNEFTLETFVLDEEFPLEYDYKNKTPILNETNLFNYLEFPLENESITVRIINNENENIDEFNFNIIDKTLSTINTSFNKMKKRFNNSDAKLVVSAPQRGSFKIDFKIPESTNLLDENDLNFFPIINIMNEINVDDRDPDFSILRDEIYSDLTKQTDNLYNAIVDENVSVNIISYNHAENTDSTVLASISPNVTIKSNLTSFKNKLEEINTLEPIVEHMYVENAQLLSASKLRNIGILKLHNNEKIKVKFDSDLFRRMKEDEVELNLTTLNADITKEYTINSEQEISGLSYTITNIAY